MEKTDELQSLKFPIGPFTKKEIYSSNEILNLISTIENAPEQYRTLVENLDAEILTRTYRQGSWTIRQLVHHVADIQLLHFFRMKKAITEKDYREVTLINMDQWAATADANEEPVEDSLLMLEGITRRYVYLIKSLSNEQLQIEYFHPVRKFVVNQAQALAMSAWHLEHHLAHIKIALDC